MKGRIVSVNASEKKGVIKQPVPEGEFREDWGLVGDSHAASWDRQVSLLAEESIERMKKKIASKGKGLDRIQCPAVEGAPVELVPGAFAENLTTRGLTLHSLPIGKRLLLGGNVILRVTRIGKKCHSDCAIFKQIGDCIMPREGIFAVVERGGKVKAGDEIVVLEQGESSEPESR